MENKQIVLRQGNNVIRFAAPQDHMATQITLGVFAALLPNSNVEFSLENKPQDYVRFTIQHIPFRLPGGYENQYNPIKAIKLIRELTGMGLVESKRAAETIGYSFECLITTAKSALYSNLHYLEVYDLNNIPKTICENFQNFGFEVTYELT